MSASFPSSVWDGELLAAAGLASKLNDSVIEPHLLRSLALDIERLKDELVAVQVYLTGEYTEDLKFPATSVKVSGSKPPTWTSYKGGEVLAFSDQAVAGNEEIVYFNVQVPHGRAANTDVEFHVHWVGEDNTAGDARWALTYSWANIAATFPTEQTLTADCANAATDEHLIHSLGKLTGTGKTRSSMIICSLRRNSSHANDTLTAKKAYLLEVDCHIKVSKLGDDFVI